MHITTHARLDLLCLTAEQREQTCSYWYTMRSNGTPYTAFRTRDALEFFLDLHGLELAEPLPDQLGTHAWITVEGKTREVMHGEIESLPSSKRRVLHLSNGDYTVGIVQEDEDGVVIHYVGPNGDRITFDHATARAHVDAGHKGPMDAVI